MEDFTTFRTRTLAPRAEDPRFVTQGGQRPPQRTHSAPPFCTGAAFRWRRQRPVHNGSFWSARNGITFLYCVLYQHWPAAARWRLALVGENLRVPGRISQMRAVHDRRQATGVSKAHRREPAMHVHNSRAREPGSPCPSPSPIGSASRRQPACRGTEVRTRMAIGANSLNVAALRLLAEPVLRAAMRGSVPVRLGGRS